jgi:uncharacterized surface protein with fasciclin (FAS1) repeats
VGDNGAIIVTADIPAFNGYIDVPDKVLVATQLSRTILQSINSTQASVSLSTLAQLILPSNASDASLQSALGQNSATGLTLLAPSDDAFTASNWTTNVYNTANNSTLTRLLLENHMIDVNLYNFQSSLSATLLKTLSGFSLWLANDDKNDTTCNGVLVKTSDLVHNG